MNRMRSFFGSQIGERQTEFGKRCTNSSLKIFFQLEIWSFNCWWNWTAIFCVRATFCRTKNAEWNWSISTTFYEHYMIYINIICSFYMLTVYVCICICVCMVKWNVQKCCSLNVGKIDNWIQNTRNHFFTKNCSFFNAEKV